jgi:hypothetical protein
MFTATFSGLVLTSSDVAWAAEPRKFMHIPDAELGISVTRPILLSKSEQQLLKKALFRSATVVHRASPTE